MSAITQATFDGLRGRFAKTTPGRDPLTPPAQGLYDPSKEHDSCGVGFVADMKNRKSHDILEKGLQILINLDHRGAVGADPSLGDGCGVLTQNSARRSLRANAPSSVSSCQRRVITRSASSSCRVKPATRQQAREIVEEVVAAEGLNVLGWRDVPVDSSVLGERVKAVEPVMQQIFVGRPADVATEDDFERRLYIVRKVVSNRVFAIGTREILEYLPRLDVGPNHCLQGHGAGAPACALLPRPPGPALRDRARAGASAVRDQHVSVLAPRAPLSHGRA